MEKTNEKPANLTAFWDKKFPGKGAALMGILAPFRGWRPELKRASANLPKSARRAIFWSDIAGVRKFRAADADELQDLVDAAPETWLFLKLFPAIKELFGVSLHASLEDALKEAGFTARHFGLWSASLGKVFVPGYGSYWAPLSATLDDALDFSLLYACAYELLDRPAEAAKFKPLHELWRTGNFPLGFDKEGNLLVLVAD